ncbi:L,D-transpeptidase family protein [Hyphomicrobium sp.]|jgi:murein L,D-transpeptidase YcbB/YkuD|uniref:L,D-transpeptidase family protein n=1 Tax=Hyphomicrobium sp. TaxID=82 RepID=UPI00356664A6
MIKQVTLRLLGVSLLGICWAGNAPAVMAETAGQDSSSGSTTYFPQSQKPPADAPATTAALPTSSDPPKDALPAASAVPPKKVEPASTAAVTPPAVETPASPAAVDSKAIDSKPDAAPSTPPTDTAIVTPPASEAPAASPAPTAEPSADSKPAAATAEPATPPAADTAQQPKPAETTPVAAPPAPPPVNPIVEAARSKLSDKALAGRNNTNDDVTAARDYYNAHTEPLWVSGGEFTRKAKELIATLKNADDWGLESSDFVIPSVSDGAAAGGAAEAQLTLSALKYARYARGGRLDPVSLSNILDMKPPVKDAKSAMRELANASDPGAYLRGLNPKHVGFERLRQALLKARGGAVAEEPVDPALLVKLPAKGKTLKSGVKDDQVALLRQRLKAPADDPANDVVYDDKLADAVRAFQHDNGLKANGVVNNRVRSALNSAGQPKKTRSSPSENVDRLIANMERWRWLPTDLGKFYVMNNIPEYTSEIWKDDRIELKQRMIVGQPSWPTPLLSAKMQFVIFKPSWGMPDGIKAKELAPRLRQASGNSGFGFFDQLFGGGGGYTGADVISAYKLQVYSNGQRVDPNSVNWKTADVRQYSFIQPPGADNPLGLVKFRFPNRHDVYMHDTPERGLFSQSARALSHGCMRVQDPRRTAEVILGEDKGYSPEKVGELWDGGASVTLSKEVPVYLVYFTARIGDDGQLDNYSDVYGIDGRVMSALRGHPVRFIAQEAIDPTEASEPGAGASVSNDAGSDDLQDTRQQDDRPDGRPAKRSATAKKSGGGNNPIQDALSNIFLN